VRRGRQALVGLDLDNTLIDYDAVFGPVGVELGLLPAELSTAPKAAVRAWLRRRADGETDWMRLQGQVYGRYIGRARLFDGVSECLGRLRDGGAGFAIVSHKTRHGHFDPRRTDLREAALGWLEARGFFDPGGIGLRRDRVLFEETREAKLARIAALGCDLFIDDLPEVLLHADFPPRTTPLWFAGAGPAAADPARPDPGPDAVGDRPEAAGPAPVAAGDGLVPYRTWRELSEAALAVLAKTGVARHAPATRKGLEAVPDPVKSAGEAPLIRPEMPGAA